ncbi:hypothetical protein NMY22_g13251 [Coprinellus aureogranulatus]|nr:hypothetical protein NMY22_g13251 [Coprinellus aureogranulatus]
MSSSTPITIQTPASASKAESTENAICKLCHRQFAKYTCPTCNVPYCSLTCFRSEAHNQCSETFYKKEIETGIHAEPSKTAQERKQILELLKRFEEESAEDAEALDEEEDESDLAKRFASVDLDSASSDEIWAMLSPEQREKFLRALQDPNSEIAKELLSSEELRRNIRLPWWEDEDDHEEEEAPTMMTIPVAMLKPVPNRPLLVYNLAAVCIAYTYVVRHLGVPSFSSKLCDCSDLETAIELLSRLVPFLMDRKSTLVYTSLSGALTDILSRFDVQNSTTPDLLSTLLRDSAHLATPLSVIEEQPGSTENTLITHPHRRLLLVLSDIAQLFSASSSLGARVPQQSKHVTHKLVFYGAHVATMPTPLLRSVAEELRAKAMELDNEREAQAQPLDTTARVARRPIVEEI